MCGEFSTCLIRWIWTSILNSRPLVQVGCALLGDIKLLTSLDGGDCRHILLRRPLRYYIISIVVNL